MPRRVSATLFRFAPLVGFASFGARYYSATMGRWLAVDPMEELNASSSAYGYARNNPLSFIDPDGNCDKYSDDPDDHCEVRQIGKDSFEVSATYMGPRWGRFMTTYRFANNRYTPYATRNATLHKANHIYTDYLAIMGRLTLESALMFVPVDKALKVVRIANVGARFRVMKGVMDQWALNSLKSFGINGGGLVAKKGVEMIGKQIGLSKDGLIEASFGFSNGHTLEFAAEKSVNGTTLELTDAVLYSSETIGNELAGLFETRAQYQILNALKEYARDEGFTHLFLQMERATNSSSVMGKNTIEKLISLY